MTNRRNFIQRLTAFGLGMSFFKGASSLPTDVSKKADGPMILCSRGEQWGEKVLRPGWDVLKASGNILDAVEESAKVTELDPDDMSVGYGGLPNEHGVVQLDASFMHGPSYSCGSVAALEGIKTPSSVARLVMEMTDHVHLVGAGALAFAKAYGFKEENLLTEKSRKAWLHWKTNLSDKDDWLSMNDSEVKLAKRPTGTINILALDHKNDVAGCTTTSGLFGKIPGRIGDSPIIGAGLYVDNEVGAAGATGRGEEILRTCGSFFTVSKMREGLSPQEACEALCKRIIDINGGPSKVDFNDKIVAIGKDGRVGCAQVRGNRDQPPKASFWNGDGFKVYDGTTLIEV